MSFDDPTIDVLNQLLPEAAGDGMLETMKFFVSKGAMDRTGKASKEAIRNDQVKALEYLIDEVVTPFSILNDDAVLHLAAQGSAKCMEYLLGHRLFNYCVNAETNYTTPLEEAIEYNCEKCIRLLLQYGANPDVIQSRCFFPLSPSIEDGNYGLCKLLVNHGVDPFTHGSFKGETYRSCKVSISYFI